MDTRGSGFEMQKGVLVRIDGARVLPVIPGDATELKAMILKELHASPLGGHLGQRKLHKLVSSRFFWPRMDVEIRDFCRACPVC